MPKLLSRSSTGKRIVIDSYYANAKANTPLGALYAPVDPRSPDPKIVYKAHRKLSLEPVTFTHLLKTAADLPNPVLSNNSLTMAIASDVSVDGVPALPGDLLEMSKALATTLKTSPGVWEFADKRTLSLKNAPVFTMSSVSAIGQPWRYRLNDQGNLIGLISVVPQNQVVTQGSVAVNAPLKLLDNSFSTWMDMASLSSGQSVTINFTAIDVRRIVLRATSSKQPGDKNMPSATFGFRNQSGPIGSLFTNIRTGLPAANGAFSYARGSEETWATDTTLRSISGFQLNDSGASRAYTSIELDVDGASRISINGEFPTNGSTIIIPEYVSSSFYPAIAAANYIVLNNDGVTPWELRKT